MPPPNDNFANAQVITGATGSMVKGTNVGATVESGEPGHYNYNPGPSYPVPRALVGPFASVWYSWTCPTTGDYWFSTRNTAGTNDPLTGKNFTDFATTCQVFLANSSPASVMHLALISKVTTSPILLDQSVGFGDGLDNGAYMAFTATAGTTYYIQVDGRIMSSSGNFILSWGAYVQTRLGQCGTTVDLADENCLATVEVADVTVDGYYEFGTYAKAAGIWLVRYMGGAFQYKTYSYTKFALGNSFIIDGYNISGFIRWTDRQQNGSGYAAGTYVYGNFDLSTGFSVAAVDIPAYAPDIAEAGPYWSSSCSGTNPVSAYNVCTQFNPGDVTSDGFNCCVAVPPHGPGCIGQTVWTGVQFYTVFAALTFYDTLAEAQNSYFCSPLKFNNNGGPIGIAFLTDTGDPAGNFVNTGQNPTFSLIYWPFTIDMLSPAASAVGAKNSTIDNNWNIGFNINNLTQTDWTGVTVTLLSTGGISSPTAPVTIDLAAATATSAGFSFVADPSAGLITATIQIERNGVVIGTLEYPLYPILVVSNIKTSDQNYSYCSGSKRTVNFKITDICPNDYSAFAVPYGGYNSSQANIYFNYSLASGHDLLKTSDCSRVATLTDTLYIYHTQINYSTGFFAYASDVNQSPNTEVLQIQPVFVGVNLPLFTSTITYPNI